MPAYHIPAEDLDLLTLGALDLAEDPAERQTMERHLRECAECQRGLVAAQARMAIVALAAPQQKPSPRAKEQLMTRIAATAQDRSAQGATAIAAPVAASRVPGSQVDGPQMPGIHQPNRTVWTLAWAGLAFGLAVAAILLWTGNERLSREMQGLRQDTAQLQQQFQQNEEQNHTLIQLFTAQDTQHIVLTPVAGQSSRPARVEYNARRGLLFYTGTLPTPAAGRSYQLWLVPVSGNPISAGVFAPDPGGRASVVLPPLPLGVAAKAFAVTIEPSGGMPQPTGPKVQVGATG
jgi:anti-sigma-K factor RskA